MAELLGGIETGGTKTVCAVGSSPTQILRRESFPTGSDPVALWAQVGQFFADAEAADGPVAAIGLGSFGPCDPHPDSPTYGYVTSTPKPGWAHSDAVGGLRSALAAVGLDSDVPVHFDTDVNAAALAEFHYPGEDYSSVDDLVYLTIGTGIGGGVIVDGKIVHGLLHPEVGHMMLPVPAAEKPGFSGVCPFHGLCAEGAAAGPALGARWGIPGPELPPDHPAWDLEADYMASLLHNVTCTVSPERIVIGGGVGLADGLLEKARPKLADSLAGYFEHPLFSDMPSYVISAQNQSNAGVIGALLMARSVAPSV